MDAAARNSADLASPKILLGSLEDIHRRVLERHMPRAFAFAAVTTLLVEGEIAEYLGPVADIQTRASDGEIDEIRGS